MEIRFSAFAATCAVFLNVAVNSWMLRSECKSEGVFGINVTDAALKRSVLVTSTVFDVQECFMMCLQHPLCQSVNYKEDALDNCELNDNIKEKLLGRYFIAKPGWTYFATDYTLRNVGPYCKEQMPCNANEWCVDTCDCSMYYCIKPCARSYKLSASLTCEAENIAFAKPSTFSSNYNGRSSALNAVDGIRSTSLLSCAETHNEKHAWIMIDLEKTALVRQITVYIPSSNNRNMGTFDVRFGSNSSIGGTSNPACKTDISTVKEMVTIACPTVIRGRYITVNTHAKSYIEVCEIEAHGEFL